MKFSEAEWRIMSVIWDRSPITARDIVESLSGKKKWAYTTVKTMLSRLVEKEALSTGQEGKATTYSPLVSQDAARRRAVDSLIDRAFDGAFGPMMNFLMQDKRLNSRQRAALQQVLDEAERENPANTPKSESE